MVSYANNDNSYSAPYLSDIQEPTLSADACPAPHIASQRARRWMKTIALTELVFSIFGLTIGSTCTGLNVGTRVVCFYGTGIWVGLICGCRAIYGLVALNPLLRRHRCVVATYFVLCLLSTLASCVLVAISGLWIERSSQYWNKEPSSIYMADYVLNVLLLVIGLLHGNFHSL